MTQCFVVFQRSPAKMGYSFKLLGTASASSSPRIILYVYVTTITCTPRVYCVFLTVVTAESLGGGKPGTNIRIRADIMYTLKRTSTKLKTLSNRFSIPTLRSFRSNEIISKIIWWYFEISRTKWEV